MNKPVFRLGAGDDIPHVVALLADDVLGRAREGGDLATYVSAFESMRREGNNHLIIAELDGRIAGCYQLVFISGLSLSAARRAQIEGVRVAHEFRGRGIGAMMFADAEARARSAGCRLMQLTSNASREDARRFYERLGFTPSHIGFKKPL